MMHRWADGSVFGYGDGILGRGMMGGLMILIWLLVIGGIGFAIYWMLSGRHRNPGGSGEDNPMTILKSRYARGEISKQEYEQMKEDLR